MTDEQRETKQDPIHKSDSRQQRLRAAEFGLVVFWFMGLFVAIDDARVKNITKLFDPDESYLWGLLTLAAWSCAPIVIRPLTTTGITLQQRYAAGALILGSGLAWLVLLGESLDNEDEPSKLGILITIGLVAAAGFIWVGWKKGKQP
jgi:hypothetical protein